MGSAVESTPADTTARNLHVLRDCLALGRPGRRRPSAKVRLEEALGPELARMYQEDSVGVFPMNMYDYAMFLDQLGETDSAAFWFAQ